MIDHLLLLIHTHAMWGSVINFTSSFTMPKGSSKDQRKAVGRNRALKRAKKAAKKGKTTAKKSSNDDGEAAEIDATTNDDSDAEDYKAHAFMPTPAQLQAQEQGACGVSLKKKKYKRKREEKQEHTQTSFKRLKIPDFTDYPPFKKNFWLGADDRGPHGDDLKMQRKSIAVLVKVVHVTQNFLHCSFFFSLLQQLIVIQGDNTALCPAPILSIEDPALPESISQVIRFLNFNKLTAVQMQCWPAILSGLNVLAIAPTGSGKTYAYGLTLATHILDQMSPPLSSVKKVGKDPYALVLVPTRELAIQVASALKPLRKLFSIRSVPIYGGQDKETQLSTLFSGGTPHIVAATPGRLLDLVVTKTLSLTSVTYLVLDEADRMLSMGFFEQLDAISNQVRPDRQSLLFSATFPGKLREAAVNWVKDGVTIKCGTFELTDANLSGVVRDVDEEKGNNDNDNDNDNNTDDVNKDNGATLVVSEACKSEHDASTTAGTPSSSGQKNTALTISNTVKQLVHLCAPHKKPRLLIKYIERIRKEEKESKVRQPSSVLVFCTKIKTLNFVADFLKRHKLKVEMIHGQLPQASRERALNDFKAGKCNTLLATDVAARGIHIKKLQHVINYDFPSNLDQYCHRVGRTGRQGAEGTSYSLITRNMAPMVGDLIDLLKSCDQPVEPNLDELAAEYLTGTLALSEEELNEMQSNQTSGEQ